MWRFFASQLIVAQGVGHATGSMLLARNMYKANDGSLLMLH